jgi:hypothetical protein
MLEYESSGSDENTPNNLAITSRAITEPRKQQLTWKDKTTSWFYTLNNYSEGDIQRLKNLECSYHIFAREVGESGTPHLQGQITFTKSIRFTTVQKLIGGPEKKAHVEKVKDLEQSRNYCLKEVGSSEDVFINDNRTKRGKRTDLESVVERVKKPKASLKDVVIDGNEVAYIKYHAGIEKLLTLYNQRNTEPRDPSRPPQVSWIFGNTGTGKTRLVVERERDLWITSGDFKYANGYTNQEAVLFDDFRGNFIKFAFMLRLLDRYPITVNIKYGFANWNPKRIYITCSMPPEKCYALFNEYDEPLEQLSRRIHFIIRLQAMGEMSIKHFIKGDPEQWKLDQ